MKNLDKHYELLSKLYLRLNGYIVSNLIIHSNENGNSNSELDILGIRMPFHKQTDRKVSTSAFLECRKDRIEIIIADVKNKTNPKNIKFNDGLRKKDSSIKKLIEWIGCYEKIDNKCLEKFKLYLNSHKSDNLISFAQFKEDFTFGSVNFKFTFFCPQLNKWNKRGYKYIDYSEMSNFIWKCLNNNEPIDTCSRVYSFKGWDVFENYVTFFKGYKESPSRSEFENHFKNIPFK